MFDISPSGIWLIIGLLGLVIEFTKLPGIGFLFLGIGGLINSILVFNYPFFEEYQYTSFGLVSFLCFTILWWPLKKYMYKKSSPDSQFDIVGSKVEVYANPLVAGKLGQVKWSGTIMNAKLVSPIDNSDVNVRNEEAIPKNNRQATKDDTRNLISIDYTSADVGETLIVSEVHGNVLICRKIAKVLPGSTQE